MRLPLQMMKTPLKPNYPTWSSPLPRAQSGAGSFSRYADKISGDFNPYADMDVKDIKTKKVRVETVDEHGNVSHRSRS